MTTDQLREDLRAFVRDDLGSGRYRSLEELLAEGVRRLREREAFVDKHRDELRAQIAAGVAQAERGDLLDGEDAMERLRRDLAERRRDE